MKKTTLFVLLGLFFLPLSVSAAWWNPFTWKKSPPVSVDSAPTSTATTTLALPSVEELYKRIAELEQKLEEARESIKKSADAVKSNVQATVTSVASSGLSEKEILAKAKPAVVLVETATTSAAASIIDAQGHILVSAHAVWVKDVLGNVVGAYPDATVTFSNGIKKKALLVGLDESSDIAILQLSDKKSSSYVKLNHDFDVSVGDKAYALGFPSSQANGGSSFAKGVVDKKTPSLVQITLDEKPLDNGGAVISDAGTLVGIPNISTCKVLEEMRTCLKYTITANIIKTKVAKLMEGMKLYRDKKSRTAEESLIRGKLEGMYKNVSQEGAIDYAINNATGKNSFDYLNGKLAGDQEKKLTKIYLNKLKNAADYIYRAFDFMKSFSYDLRITLINENASILALDNYQQKVIRQIEASNNLMLKEYQSRIDLWSKKKNEYDSYLTKLEDATHDYLMEQGTVIESEAEYLITERRRLLDSFSGENVDIF